MTNTLQPGPIFIVGIWRSGTSLLYTLLNQHPQIALTYESDLFLLRSLFRRGKPKSDWLERWEFWNNALRRHNIEPAKISPAPTNYPTAATEVWKQYAGQALYGDKSPNYFDSMPALAREFPNARFIVIWRDLETTCNSIAQAAEGSSFFAKRGIAHRALIGYRKMKRDCDLLTRKGFPLHQIHYEELVQSPATVMQAICWFLQVPFDPRMATLDGADRSAIYEAPQHAGVKSEKIGVRKKPNSLLSNKLKQKISRYVAYWKNQSAGSWPVYPSATADPKPAGIFERAQDEIYFQALRAFDRFTAFVYCYAPISLLRRYRGAKSQAEKSASEAPALSQTPERELIYRE
jgi:hypothetical protein